MISFVCVYVYVVRRCKIYFISKFQVYNTVLLTLVTMLNSRFPELVYLIIRRWLGFAAASDGKELPNFS